MSLLRTRLSVMMFLEFFIWGAWFPLVFDFVPSLGFSGWQKDAILNAFFVSALVAVFFSNQFADRTFSAEKFLAFSHLVGGVAILALSFLPGKIGTQPGEFQRVQAVKPGDQPDRGEATLPDGRKIVIEQLGIDWSKIDTADQKKLPTVTAEVTKIDGNVIHARRSTLAPFWPFFGLLLLHTLLYVPTISITNSIAFANMPSSKDFGFVRLWGTIGWIAVAWPFVFILVDWKGVGSIGDMGFVTWLKDALRRFDPSSGTTAYTFTAAGVASLLLAAFSLVLPHTPPKKSGEPLAWLEALKLLRHPFILVLFFVTFLDAAVHQFFFYWSATFLKVGVKIPGNWVMPVMSIGQVAEIVTMAFLALVLKNLGWRFTMVVGILGHAARFAVFAFAQQLPEELRQPAAIGVNVLHGICYAFFFATVYIFIDEYFPKDARTSAQGLFNMLILGLGPIASNFVSGRLGEFFAPEGSPPDFQSIFLVPLATALVAATLLLLFFHPPAKKAEV